jgi:hypothetical protein
MEIPYPFWTCPILPNVFSPHVGEQWAFNVWLYSYVIYLSSCYFLPLRSEYSSRRFYLEYNLYNVFKPFITHIICLSFLLTLNVSFTSFSSKNNILRGYSLTICVVSNFL